MPSGSKSSTRISDASRHRPEQTALYAIVAEHYPRFVHEIERAGGYPSQFACTRHCCRAGAAPVQRAIAAGDTETGVRLMQMDAGLDSGPVLLRRRPPIGEQETAAELSGWLAEIGAGLLLEGLHALTAGHLPAAETQPADGVTWARKVGTAEARLDWGQDAATLARRVRAFNPRPMAWCLMAGERTRIWAARALPWPGKAPPGTVVRAAASGIQVATADGPLVLLRLQRPGGRPISGAEYLNARSVPARLVP